MTRKRRKSKSKTRPAESNMGQHGEQRWIGSGGSRMGQVGEKQRHRPREDSPMRGGLLNIYNRRAGCGRYGKTITSVLDAYLLVTGIVYRCLVIRRGCGYGNVVEPLCIENSYCALESRPIRGYADYRTFQEDCEHCGIAWKQAAGEVMSNQNGEGKDDLRARDLEETGVLVPPRGRLRRARHRAL